MKNKKNFTESVYEVVRKIPKGKTMTYKDVAKAIGRPLSFRAVGTALSKNYNKKIPCHRVIRSDGLLGNYNRGGHNVKKRLLTVEGVI